MPPTRRSEKQNDKSKANSMIDRTTPTTTNKSKRVHSPNTSAEESNTVKKTKSSKLSSMDIEELKNIITASGDKIENKIDGLAEKMKDEVNALRSTVVEFNTKINDELKHVKSQLSIHSERIDNNDDDYQRAQRNHDLRVTGFEANVNEDLYDIFKRIAAAIGFVIGPNTAMPSIERVHLYNKTTNKSTPTKTMLLHFAILRQKQQFYSMYLSKMPLDPVQFGLESTNRIVISENLIKKNAQVFKQALTMKKNKKIAQAFT